MKLDLKNDTLLVHVEGKFEMLQLKDRLKDSNLILPDSVDSLTVDAYEPEAVPPLQGTIVRVGPGGSNKEGKIRDIPEELTPGTRILFQIGNEIATREEDGSYTFLIGVGNVLATLEED